MLFIMLLIITLMEISTCVHFHLVDKAKIVSGVLLKMGDSIRNNEIIMSLLLLIVI